MSNSFGMPKVQITFMSLGLSAIRRSARGVALLILKDELNNTKQSYRFRNLAEVEDGIFNAANMRMIKLAFAGKPYRLHIETYDGTDRTLGKLLESIQLDKWNYYAAPLATEEEQDTILSWHDSVVREKDKTIKFVGYNEPADDLSVINWTPAWVSYDGERYEGAEFTAHMVAVLAGLDLQRSVTFYDFSGKVDAADMPFVDDEDAAVNAGKLFITYDGEFYKVSRGVNSLVTHTAIVGEDQSKIRIVEAMHLIKDDIRDTFIKEYVGKILNTYANKQQFIALVNRVYFPSLWGELLEQEANNHVDIDMDANAAYAVIRGVDMDSMTEMQIRTYNTGSNVFLRGTLSLLDAMEDLVINFKLD